MDSADHDDDARRPATDLADYFAGDDDADLADGSADIGERLRQARATAGVDRRDIAGRLGVRETTIEKWESGSTSPRGHHLSKLAGMLGVSISWILMGRGVEPTEAIDDVDQIRADLDLVRSRLEDAANELTVLDHRLRNLS